MSLLRVLLLLFFAVLINLVLNRILPLPMDGTASLARDLVTFLTSLPFLALYLLVDWYLFTHRRRGRS